MSGIRRTNHDKPLYVHLQADDLSRPLHLPISFPQPFKGGLAETEKSQRSESLERPDIFVKFLDQVLLARCLSILKCRKSLRTAGLRLRMATTVIQGPVKIARHLRMIYA